MMTGILDEYCIDSNNRYSGLQIYSEEKKKIVPVEEASEADKERATINLIKAMAESPPKPIEIVMSQKWYNKLKEGKYKFEEKEF